MIDKTLVQNLFNFIKANQDISFDDFINVIVSQTEHTTETATEWVYAFIFAMYVPKIIENKTFDDMKLKVNSLDDNGVDTIIDITEKYLLKNPLKYHLKEELSILSDEKLSFEDMPDIVENIEKISNLSIINERIDEINVLLK